MSRQEPAQTPGRRPALRRSLTGPGGGAVEAREEDAEAGYFVVRRSLSAVTLLRPDVYAAEVTIDFLESPPSAADLAIGLATEPQGCSLFWPRASSPASRPQERQEAGDGVAWAASGTPAAAGSSSASEPKPQSWWWRCDGSSLDGGERGLRDGSAVFGAGDVVGVAATLEGGSVVRLDLLRNGHVVASRNCREAGCSAWAPPRRDPGAPSAPSGGAVALLRL